MSRWAFYALALSVFVLDQATKALLRATVDLHQSIPLWPGVFHITHTRNTGAAFSLFAGHPQYLAVAALVVIVIIILAQRRLGDRMPLSLGLALALPLGGALGNLLDRVRLRYVTDMFDLTVINFPVFNIADSAITVGIILLMVRTLFVQDEKEDRRVEAEPAPPAAPAEDAPAA